MSRKLTIVGELAARPKGMHRATFERLLRAANQLIKRSQEAPPAPVFRI